MTGVRWLAFISMLCGAACDAGAGPESARETQGPTDPTIAAADPAVVERCTSCHHGAMSLAARPPDELTEAIRAIVEGRRPHVPLELPDSSASTIRNLADDLTGD